MKLDAIQQAIPQPVNWAIGKTAPVLGIAQNREVGISDTPLLPVPVCVHGKQE